MNLGSQYLLVYPDLFGFHKFAGSVVYDKTVIQISISGGAETNTVPNITGMSADEAVHTLGDLGFAVQIETEYSSGVAENAVISQSIEENSELEIGESITLMVSKGIDPSNLGEEKLTVVPNFVGMSYEDAQKKSQDVGFLLSILSREYSSEFDKGIIMSQSVFADSEIMSGNTIQLVVSHGIQAIKVADVQYKSETEARRILGGQGLKVDVSYLMSEIVASGLVISQSPAAQTSVEPNDTVSLVVSKGGESFSMPNVAGMDEAAARNTLTSKGLSVSVNYEKSSTIAEGKVIKQSVAANTSVNKGNQISITVSSGQDLISVANVVGQSETTARNTLSAQGLNSSVSEAYSETVTKGQVISQSPAAGTSQTKNATIIITVSKTSIFFFTIDPEKNGKSDPDLLYIPSFHYRNGLLF